LAGLETEAEPPAEEWSAADWCVIVGIGAAVTAFGVSRLERRRQQQGLPPQRRLLDQAFTGQKGDHMLNQLFGTETGSSEPADSTISPTSDNGWLGSSAASPRQSDQHAPTSLPINHQHHEPDDTPVLTAVQPPPPDDTPPPRRQTPATGWVTRGLWTLAACLLSVGGLLTLRDADPRDLPQLPSAVASVAQDEAEAVRYLSKPIREIQPIVDRVLADNPETDGQAESDLGPIQAAQWRLLSLRMAEGDGGELRATIARPVWWIESVLAEHSGRVPLESGELGIAGFAEVLETRPCPQPRPGQGRLVTGVYEHTRADVIDVHITGEPAPLGTTANHPFWSEDRQSFVAASDLRPGEQVRLADGRLTPVEKVGSHRRTEPVYNLEVDGEHVYYVGQGGVLVHNANGPCLSVPSGTDVAFGFSRHGNSTLVGFADGLRKITGRDIRIYYNDFGGFTRRTTERFGRVFNDVTKRADKIHFNLDGIDDPVKAALSGRGGFARDGSAPWTFAELNLIKTTPELLEKTVFYRTNKVTGLLEKVDSPF
jgi:hypothetical protein